MKNRTSDDADKSNQLWKKKHKGSVQHIQKNKASEDSLGLWLQQIPEDTLMADTGEKVLQGWTQK